MIYLSTNQPYEQELYNELKSSVFPRLLLSDVTGSDCYKKMDDIFILFTLKTYGEHKEFLKDKRYIMFDKGFTRGNLVDKGVCLKVTVNSPKLKYYPFTLDDKRLGTISGMRYFTNNHNLKTDAIICTSSDYYHQVYDLPPITEYVDFVEKKMVSEGFKHKIRHKSKPLRCKGLQDNKDMLKRFGLIVGHGTATLMDGIILNKSILCLDPEYFMAQLSITEPNWVFNHKPTEEQRMNILKFASYHNYSWKELTTKKPWEFIQQNYNLDLGL